MKLEYSQRLSMLSTDEELKKNKVDKLWNNVVWRNKEIAEDLFNLLYENKDLSFEYRDITVPINITEEKVKNWDKRYYLNYKTHLLIREKIPLIKKVGHITSATADKIKEVLTWMKYCEEALNIRVVESKPLEVKPTQEIVQERRDEKREQLTFNFDEEPQEENKGERENKRKENKVSKEAKDNPWEETPNTIYFSKDDLPEWEVPKEKKKFSDDQINEIYWRDDDEPWWNRI